MTLSAGVVKLGALMDAVLSCPHCQARAGTLLDASGAEPLFDLIGGDTVPGGHEVMPVSAQMETFDQVMLTGRCPGCAGRFSLLVVKRIAGEVTDAAFLDAYVYDLMFGDGAAVERLTVEGGELYWAVQRLATVQGDLFTAVSMPFFFTEDEALSWPERHEVGWGWARRELGAVRLKLRHLAP